MSDIIKILPTEVSNKIAAGEVVQRPASVVKELLENSIDAESTKIKLVVKDSGKTLIQVVDNGVGMTKNDMKMSFENHATSKIKNIDDLKLAKGELVSHIKEIENEIEFRIESSFNSISVHFSEIFETLFPGGKLSLIHI